MRIYFWATPTNDFFKIFHYGWKFLITIRTFHNEIIFFDYISIQYNFNIFYWIIKYFRFLLKQIIKIPVQNQIMSRTSSWVPDNSCFSPTMEKQPQSNSWPLLKLYEIAIMKANNRELIISVAERGQIPSRRAAPDINSIKGRVIARIFIISAGKSL